MIVIDWEWVKVTAPSLNLYKEIDKCIKNYSDFKNSDGDYGITIYADNRYGRTIAECKLTAHYESNCEYLSRGEITGITFDTNGTMKWNKYPGAVKYEVSVSDCTSTVKTNTFAINSRINYLVSAGYIYKSSPYSIYIDAYDSDGIHIAYWYGSHNYNTSSKEVTVGKIANLKSTNGILTWSKYKGAVKYTIRVNYSSKVRATTAGNSCYINNVITSLIAQQKLAYDSSYTIHVEALNKQGGVIAEEYLYNYMLLETNTLNVTGKTVKASRRKKKSFTAGKAYTFKNKGEGKITYSKASGDKKIKVSANGKITVKKGLKRKTYKLKVNVKAAGASIYAATVKTVTVKIKVK